MELCKCSTTRLRVGTALQASRSLRVVDLRTAQKAWCQIKEQAHCQQVTVPANPVETTNPPLHTRAALSHSASCLSSHWTKHNRWGLHHSASFRPCQSTHLRGNILPLASRLRNARTTQRCVGRVMQRSALAVSWIKMDSLLPCKTRTRWPWIVEITSLKCSNTRPNLTWSRQPTKIEKVSNTSMQGGFR